MKEEYYSSGDTTKYAKLVYKNLDEPQTAQILLVVDGGCEKCIPKIEFSLVLDLDDKNKFTFWEKWHTLKTFGMSISKENFEEKYNEITNKILNYRRNF